MFTPYQREPIHGLSSIWTTVNHTLADAELAPSVCFRFEFETFHQPYTE
jgi:hypothetical protein